MKIPSIKYNFRNYEELNNNYKQIIIERDELNKDIEIKEKIIEDLKYQLSFLIKKGLSSTELNDPNYFSNVEELIKKISDYKEQVYLLILE